jgi:hypothetical protein
MSGDIQRVVAKGKSAVKEARVFRPALPAPLVAMRV